MPFIRSFCLLFLPFFAFAQSEPAPVLKFEQNSTEIRFFLSHRPEKTVFILPKNRPVLSVAEAKIKTLKQHFGSVKLKWKIAKNEDFYFDKMTWEVDTLGQTDFETMLWKIDTLGASGIIILKNKKNKTRKFNIIYTNEWTQHKFNFRPIKTYLITDCCHCAPRDNDYERLTWHIPLFEGENVYGGGEQFSYTKLNGHKLPFLVEEQGIGRGDNPISFMTKFKNASGNKTSTFMPIARFVTSQKRYFEADNRGYQLFDFSEKKCFHWQQFNPINEMISDFFTLKIDKKNWNIVSSNYFPLQPAWMFRTILGLQGGTDTVLQKLKILTDAGVQPSAVWTQDWCGRRVTPFGKQLVWNWQLDTVRYPRFAAFRDGLRQKNIRLLGYINPFLAENTSLDKEAVLDSTILIQNGSTKKPFLMRATGFNVHLLALDESYVQKIVQKNLIDNGFSGWMADFGEWYPLDKRESSAIGHHNIYPTLWNARQAQIAYLYTEKTKNTDTLGIFMRSTTSNYYSHVYWAGDQNTNWQKNDGLPSLVPALLSSGLSGIAINHGDIGGFTSFKKGWFKMTRSRELLYRWTELCAFTPVFRTHEGLAPDYNMQVYSDTACAKFFARFSKIHDDLHPYIMRTYRETQTEHLPMVRHLMLHFADDPNVADLQYQFMLGSEILVLPVLKKGAKTVRGYLPKGLWQHFFTKKITESVGEWRTFEAPLGQPAVFWRL